MQQNFRYSISVSKIASSDWFDTLMRVSSSPTVSKMIGMLPYKEELRKKMVTDRIKDRITFAGAYFPKAIGKRSVKHRHLIHRQNKN